MLNKNQLISALSAESLVDEADVREVIGALVRITEREMFSGGGVSIPGFGKMSTRETPRRMVRNPKTGERALKGPGSVPKFQISAKLRRSVKDS